MASLSTTNTGASTLSAAASGLKTTGVLELQLCDVKPGTFDAVHVDMLDEKTDPAFAGSVAEFLAHHAGVDAAVLRRQLLNNVKKCPGCGKPNAYTLDTCNGCGADLSAVPLSHTNNVFTGFVFGIARGPFPFTISLRAQTPRTLVFDDLLALSPCHVNAIPTDAYLPDIRGLFARPRAGLALVDRLFGAVWGVARAQFLGRAGWARRVMGAEAAGLPAEAIRAHAITGFNFPPSQYQLHLQFMLPPCTPFHWSLFQKGVHCTPRRFFPFEYVRAALAALVAAGAAVPGAAAMPIDALLVSGLRLNSRTLLLLAPWTSASSSKPNNMFKKSTLSAHTLQPTDQRIHVHVHGEKILTSSMHSLGDSHEAAMVSIESGRLGGQYPDMLPVCEAATLITTTRGPGVSGTPIFV